MWSPDFLSVSNSLWASIYARIKNAVVFIDNGAAECLHWDGGLLRLYESGALDVKEFSSFESCSAPRSKAVFILSAPLWRVTLNILQDIIRNSQIHHCVIVTAADARVHTLLKYGSFEGGAAERDQFASLRMQVLDWMGNRNYVAEIFCVPIFLASICPAVFVTPPFSMMFPPLPRAMHSSAPTSHSDRLNLGDKKPGFRDDLQLRSLPLDVQVSVAQFVTNFNAVMEMLNARESYYSLGQFSRIISIELEELPAAGLRRKVAQNKLSVLFIDRTLDLGQATSYDFETLLDRILHLLPKLSGHATDVMVDISPLASVKIPTDSKSEVPLLVPGCLAHSKDRVSAAILNSMMTSRHKNCILEVNRHLVEAISKQQLNEDSKMSRVTADTLLAGVLKFKNNLQAIESHLGILQHSLAIVQALQHPGNVKIDTLLGVEKALMQLLGEEGTSKLRIAQLIKERNTRGLTIEEILILLTRVCTLKGKGFISVHDEQVDMLKAVLGDALLQDYDQLPNYIKENIGPEVDELTIHAMVTKLFDALYAVSNTREDLKKYSCIFDPGSTTQPASYTPLMKQLLEDIFNPAKPDLIDLECRNTGLRDILKSGLGLFMNVTKPRPTDNQTILVYVVGGITSTEVRQIQELVTAHKPTHQVLVGSTRIALPKDTLQLLIESPNDVKC